MAESIARRVLADLYGITEEKLADYGFSVDSAGTSAMDGGRPSAQGVEALRNLGYNPPRGTSTRLRTDMIEDAAHVYTMTEDQRRRVIDMVPGSRAKVELVDPKGRDVQDPIGSSVAVYEECARLIRAGLDERLKHI